LSEEAGSGPRRLGRSGPKDERRGLNHLVGPCAAGFASRFRLPPLHSHALSGNALQRFGDKLAAVVYAVERDEAAHAGALARAQQSFIQRLEPRAEVILAEMLLADFENGMLNRLAIVIRG